MSVIVVGAGASGLAAARALQAAGFRAVVLEASSHVGGRMKTNTDFSNFPLELGAEFIHGDGALTHKLLAEAGLSSIPVDRYGNLWWADKGQPAKLYTTLDSNTPASIKKLFEDKHALKDANFDVDVSLEKFLRSRGRTEAELAIADVLLCQTQNARVDKLSCADWKHEYHVDTAGDGESRVQEGYSKFVDWLSWAVDVIHLETPVQAIHWNSDKVSCHSSTGEVFKADACIITASLAALQRDTITFQPPLPASKQQAIHALAMHPATKLIYFFRKQLWPDDLTYINHNGACPRWWTSAYKRPSADAVIAAFITADRAAAIDAMDEKQALDVGLEELSTLLGIDVLECRGQLVKATRVSWATVPYIWGGYSSCPPGAHPMRFTLAAPTEGTLFWAGEATVHHSNPQTVHGALESGLRAAAECIAAIKARDRARL